jgi:hypothetical protein
MAQGTPVHCISLNDHSSQTWSGSISINDGTKIDRRATHLSLATVKVDSRSELRGELTRVHVADEFRLRLIES